MTVISCCRSQRFSFKNFDIDCRLFTNLRQLRHLTKKQSEIFIFNQFDRNKFGHLAHKYTFKKTALIKSTGYFTNNKWNNIVVHK